VFKLRDLLLGCFKIVLLNYFVWQLAVSIGALASASTHWKHTGQPRSWATLIYFIRYIVKISDSYYYVKATGLGNLAVNRFQPGADGLRKLNVVLKMEKSIEVSFKEQEELASTVTERRSTERGSLDAKTIKWIAVNAVATVAIVSPPASPV
jgi:hypothetical protein